jgi:hypothetical protein
MAFWKCFRWWACFSLLAFIGISSSRYNDKQPDFHLKWKQTPLPLSYAVTMLLAVVLLEALPYIEELMRGLREGRRVLKKR